MTCSDDETWDLASSVGATASMVAAAKAVATRVLVRAAVASNLPFKGS
jgi:hypothetical protein